MYLGNTTNRFLCAALLAPVVAMERAQAGDLNPPAGVIAPTMKPLDVVEPRIAINSDNTPGEAGFVHVISQPGSYYLTSNLVVPQGLSGIKVSVDGVSIDLMGFSILGDPGSLDGIFGLGLRRGISIRSGAIQGLDTGIEGFASQLHLTDLHILDSSAGAGIRSGTASLIERCTVTDGASQGILAGVGSIIRNCTVRANGGIGITVGSASLVEGCIVISNGSDGINAGDGVFAQSIVIRDCVVADNSGNGIRVDAVSLVTRNICRNNGFGAADGAGIHVASGSDSRIEGNLVAGNDRGIDVDTVGNLVIGNSASGNTTNFSIAANNTVGPTVNSANIATSSNPHANYEF